MAKNMDIGCGHDGHFDSVSSRARPCRKQRCGVSAAALWHRGRGAVPTAHLSNHPRYSSKHGGPLNANFVRDLLTGDTPAATIHTLAIEPRTAWMATPPRLSCRPSGTGDLFTALFAAAIVQGHSTEVALSRAVSGVHAVLEETERQQSLEMALIASAARMVRPDRLFEASAIPMHAVASNTSGPRHALPLVTDGHALVAVRMHHFQSG
jgi:pyridoxal/pyridoxine/pyridoxamine kinase